jgi:hypothetical protein
MTQRGVKPIAIPLYTRNAQISSQNPLFDKNLKSTRSVKKSVNEEFNSIGGSTTFSQQM